MLHRGSTSYLNLYCEGPLWLTMCEAVMHMTQRVAQRRRLRAPQRPRQRRAASAARRRRRARSTATRTRRTASCCWASWAPPVRDCRAHIQASTAGNIGQDHALLLGFASAPWQEQNNEGSTHANYTLRMGIAPFHLLRLCKCVERRRWQYAYCAVFLLGGAKCNQVGAQMRKARKLASRKSEIVLRACSRSLAPVSA